MADKNKPVAEAIVDDAKSIVKNGQSQDPAEAASKLTDKAMKMASDAQASAVDAAKGAVDTVSEMGTKAKQRAAEAPAEVKETATSMLGLTHKVLLAGVGALALTKDEIEEFVSKLVERGEMAEQDGRKMLNDVWARRRRSAQKVEDAVGEQISRLDDQWEKAEAAIDERIENVLGQLNVPTKDDIDVLSEKITALSAKVDALKKS